MGMTILHGYLTNRVLNRRNGTRPSRRENEIPKVSLHLYMGTKKPH